MTGANMALQYYHKRAIKYAEAAAIAKDEHSKHHKDKWSWYYLLRYFNLLYILKDNS